jgi:transposase
VCGDFTGIYAMTAAIVFNKQNIDFWLENPSQIKLSSGINREKNDKVDSGQIALYALRFLDRVKLYKPQNDTLLKIRELVGYKDRLTKNKSQLIVPDKELKRVRNKWDEVDYIYDSSKEMVEIFDAKIKEIEHKMLSLLKAALTY